MNNSKLFNGKLSFFNNDIIESESYLSICMDYKSMHTQNYHNYLNPIEIEILNKISNKKRRENYIIGRYVGKMSCANYYKNTLLKDFCISNGIFGQPLLSPNNKQIQVSISHSNFIACSIAFENNILVGIDIENNNKKGIVNIRKILSREENELYNDLNVNESTKSIIFWTVKEALAKALKIGVISDWRLYEIQEISYNDNILLSKYKAFSRFNCISFFSQQFICSIAYPSNLKIKESQLLKFID